MKTEKYSHNETLYLSIQKFIQGSLIGSMNAIITTPFAGLANRVNERAEFSSISPTPLHSVRRMFDGTLCYNMAFVMRVGVSIAINSTVIHLLEYNYQQQLDEKHRLGISVIAGGIAGAPANIPEAIAQIKQLSPNPKQKPSAHDIITRVYQSNGLFGLGKGTLMTMARSAGLASGYLQIMPMVCEKMRQHIANPQVADLFSALISGIGVGFITTPPNRLRFLMHKEYLSQQPTPKYLDLLYQEMKSRKLFTGLLPRTGYAVVTMFVIHTGNRLCNLYSEQGYPDLPWFKPSN